MIENDGLIVRKTKIRLGISDGKQCDEFLSNLKVCVSVKFPITSYITYQACIPKGGRQSSRNVEFSFPGHF